MKKMILLLVSVLGLTCLQAQVLELKKSPAAIGARTSKINAETLAGKVVVMVFWNTTDERCQADLPEVIEMSNWYKNDKQVVFLAPTPESKQSIDQYTNGQTGNLRIIPEAHDLIRQYGVVSFPTYLVLDQNGQNAFNGRSLPTSSEIKDQLSEKINELKTK